MFLKLRIFFTILATACLAVILPVGALWGWGWAGFCGLVAALFFGLMLLCKQKQEEIDPPTQNIQPLSESESDPIQTSEKENQTNAQKEEQNR